jgi:hypothetical protein
MQFVDRRPNGDVDVLAGIVHGHARERHPMLPTDQSTYAPRGCGHRLQATAIAVSPDEPFSESWDQLSMVILELAVV